MFLTRQTKKSYLAIVRGYSEVSGHIDYPLKEQLDKMTDRKARKDKGPQEAITAYRRLGTVEFPFPVSRYPAARYSLLRVLPQTGRKHQIRRHMKHIMHPIVGDTKYGRGEHNRLFREKFDADRLLLHAQTLRFDHPISGKPMRIKAGLDEVFERVFDQAGWSGLSERDLDEQEWS